MHTDTWEGNKPINYGKEKFSSSINKMENGENIDILVLGDSISTGANASGYIKMNYGRKIKGFFDLFANDLSEKYDIEVNYKNVSRGGWDTRDAISEVPVEGTSPDTGEKDMQAGIQKLFEDPDKLKGYEPDIALIGFGMNDATHGISVVEYVNNTKKIVDPIKQYSPDCDIVLIGTWVANPESYNDQNQQLYAKSLYKVAELYDDVAVVDMAPVTKDILNSGKRFIEISANNVNHPNDFSTRLYAIYLNEAFKDAE